MSHTHSRLLYHIKSYSSGWIKRRYGLHGFAWLEGFGPFSISASRLQQVIDYVENQQEHHRTKTFQEEYEDFLRRHGVKYAPEDLFNGAP